MSHPTSGSKATHQRVVREFAFAGRPATSHQSDQVKQLHQRADQMFACGYHASGWALRERAWRLEARA